MMRTHKQISFGPLGHDKTPMQVLHSILPKMQVSGFHRERTSIFEEDCLGRIEYSLKTKRSTSRNHKARNDNAPIAFTLDINIVPHTDNIGTFSIYSEITPVDAKEGRLERNA